jgi:hypothetical protein
LPGKGYRAGAVKGKSVMMAAVIMTTEVMESKEEHWSNGEKENGSTFVAPTIQYSNTPLLHYSKLSIKTLSVKKAPTIFYTNNHKFREDLCKQQD